MCMYVYTYIDNTLTHVLSDFLCNEKNEREFMFR